MMSLSHTQVLTEAIRVTGIDRFSFLQGQAAGDLRPIENGERTCGWSLWLDARGRIVGGTYIDRPDPETWRLWEVIQDADALHDHLDAHLIGDEVELEVIAETATLELTYPADEAAEADGAYRNTVSARLIPGAVSAESNTGSAFADWCWANEVASPPGDIRPGDLPGEVGQTGFGASLIKGCYTGQEVVARLHNLGRARFELRPFFAEQVCAVDDPVFAKPGDKKALGNIRRCWKSGEHFKGFVRVRALEKEAFPVWISTQNGMLQLNAKDCG
jgi:folate-binding protein YgfZ